MVSIPATLMVIPILLAALALAALTVWLIVLAIRALQKYLRGGEAREEKKELCRTLGEAIRANRERCKMTQEFVAESLGVSRQAVSKWERGTSDPSTANLMALAKLFGVSAEELLRQVDRTDTEEN